MKSLVALFALAGYLAVAAPSVWAQQDPNLEQGLKPYGSYSGGNIDAVSLSNGNLSVWIPLISYPQRGNLKYGLAIRYNNKNWQKVQVSTNPIKWDYQWRNGSAGVQIVDANQPSLGSTTVRLQDINGVYFYDHTYYVISPDGSTHQQVGVTNAGTRTLDGSGFNYYFNGSRVIVDRAGVAYTVIGPTQDTNGNQLTFNSTTGVTTDTLGRQMPGFTSSTTTGCPAGSTSAYAANFPAPNGGTSTVKYCQQSYSISTQFNDTNTLEGSATVTMINAVILPNGTKWQFGYNSWGDLTSITFPTGGAITYGYGSKQFNALSCVSAPPTAYSRIVTTRTVNANDGTGNHIWTYTYNDNANYTKTTIVDDPTGNDVAHDFTNVGELTWYETETRYYQGTVSQNVVLKKVDTTYTAGYENPDCLDGGADVWVQVFPTSVTTTIGSKTSQTTSTYDSGYQYSYTTNVDGTTTTGPFIFGSVVHSTESDFGAAPSPGSVVRQHANSFLWMSNANALSANLLDLLTSSIAEDGSGTRQAETDYGYDQTSLQSSGVTEQHVTPTAPMRGNLTTVGRWLNTTGTNLNTLTAYYDTGMPYQVTDPKNNTTTFSYSSSFYGAYVTQVQRPTTNGVTHITTSNYDFNTGLVTTATDENGQSTTYSYDSSFRLTQEVFPDGGQINWAYQDYAPFKVTVTKKVTSTVNEQLEGDVDGVGRLIQTKLLSDPEGTVYTDTTYDAAGRLGSVSNPYRSTSESTYGVTSYLYDGLGRTTTLIPPDGSSGANNVSTTYTDNCTTVTDQAGKQRKSCLDALGRLTQVFEAPGSLNYETDYQYDTLGNLKRVDQKGGSANSSDWHTRLFTYDSLARLLTANNPESGSQTYTYDNNSNVATKLDARAITITYSYDELNRLKTKTYSNSEPTISYTYDGANSCASPYINPKPHRTSMSDASGSTSWCFDVTGRTRSDQRTIGTIAKTTTYGYNLDGSLATLTYPSGRTITYTWSGAGRALSAVDTADSITYAKSATYAPQGALAGALYGWSGSFAGIAISNSYNKRLQPTQLSATAPSQTLLSLTYNFGLGMNDNGNVQAITNNLDGVQPNRPDGSAAYSYDDLNRVTSAHTQGTDCTVVAGGLTKDWGQNFTYDAWGNLSTVAVSRCSAQSFSAAILSNNRLSGYSYDADGNMTNDGANSYTYNAESQISTVAGVTYTYDGDGERVEKSSGKLYWTGTGSDPLDESDLSGTINEEYIFFDGRRIARADVTSNNTISAVHYYFADHLGSAETVTNATGTTIEQEADYYPFGGERAIISGPNNYKFTGKERDDLGSGKSIDYFGARFYGSAMGRWLSPDWSGTVVPVPYALFTDPQTLNLYSYVRDNPLATADLDGHLAWQPIQRQPRSGEPWTMPVPSGLDPNFAIDAAQAAVAVQMAQANLQGQAPAQNNSSPRVVDIVNSALQQPNLSSCLNTWIGPGLVLTNDNLPYMDATKSNTQLATIAGSKDPVDGTVKEPVPASGRSTVYVASNLMGDKNEAMRTYIHETGNALAMQKFAGGNDSGAYLGARGGPPGIAQKTGNNPWRDRDIGYQIEVCVFGPRRIQVPSTTITVTGN